MLGSHFDRVLLHRGGKGSLSNIAVPVIPMPIIRPAHAVRAVRPPNDIAVLHDLVDPLLALHTQFPNPPLNPTSMQAAVYEIEDM